MPLNINTEVGILPVPGHPIRVAQDGTWLIQSIADAVTVNTHAVTVRHMDCQSHYRPCHCLPRRRNPAWNINTITGITNANYQGDTPTNQVNTKVTLNNESLNVAPCSHPVWNMDRGLNTVVSWNVNVNGGSLALLAGSADRPGSHRSDHDGSTNKVYVGNTISATQSGMDDQSHY